MKRLLLTRTRHDTTTHYLYEYCREVVKAAEEKGWRVDEANTPKEVQSRLEKTSYELAFFNGHGNEECICGQDDEVLVGIEDASLLSGKSVYSRTCASLKKLGKEAVSKGCNEYVGYNDNFIFFTINEMEANALE